MALFIEYSPAVQEVPGSFPRWDSTVSDVLCKGCWWLWSSLYNITFMNFPLAVLVSQLERIRPLGYNKQNMYHLSRLLIKYFADMSHDIYIFFQLRKRKTNVFGLLRCEDDDWGEAHEGVLHHRTRRQPSLQLLTGKSIPFLLWIKPLCHPESGYTWFHWTLIQAHLYWLSCVQYYIYSGIFWI